MLAPFCGDIIQRLFVILNRADALIIHTCSQHSHKNRSHASRSATPDTNSTTHLKRVQRDHMKGGTARRAPIGLLQYTHAYTQTHIFCSKADRAPTQGEKKIKHQKSAFFGVHKKWEWPSFVQNTNSTRSCTSTFCSDLHSISVSNLFSFPKPKAKQAYDMYFIRGF